MGKVAAGRWSRILLSAFAGMATGLFCGAASADVALAGVSGSKAVLVIDGMPKTLRVGESHPAGIRLLSVEGASALVEIQGRKERLALGEGSVRLEGNGPESAVAHLTADSTGHHLGNGTINGAGVRFLVDTGASVVSLGRSDALRAGIDLRAGESGMANTASGPARMTRVRLDSVRIDGLTLHGVEGLVLENDLPYVLLGMSFLNRVDMQRDGARLVLRKRY